MSLTIHAIVIVRLDGVTAAAGRWIDVRLADAHTVLAPHAFAMSMFAQLAAVFKNGAMHAMVISVRAKGVNVNRMHAANVEVWGQSVSLENVVIAI